jgi:hypothetical protein
MNDFSLGTTALGNQIVFISSVRNAILEKHCYIKKSDNHVNKNDEIHWQW